MAGVVAIQGDPFLGEPPPQLGPGTRAGLSVRPAGNDYMRRNTSPPTAACRRRPLRPESLLERRKIIRAAKRPDLPALWRRRESNPRPRTHRSEPLQACSAVGSRPTAGGGRPTGGPAILWCRALGDWLSLRAEPVRWRRYPNHGPSPERRRYLTRLGSECEVLVRTYLVCRWIYEANRRPRLAALPENRPRRNQVAPVCRLPNCSRPGIVGAGASRLRRSLPYSSLSGCAASRAARPRIRRHQGSGRRSWR
jgi:hypothetical protein